jgi:RHS repeat-associated protein
VLQSYQYDLDATGRRTAITEQNGRRTDYSYDSLYRLTGETVNGSYNATYSYGPTGNRLQQTINGVTTHYAYDANDRLTQQGATSYTYDDNGNTLTETLGGDVTTYTYNARNKLTGLNKTESGQSSTGTYSYHPDGTRTGQTLNGVETRYIVDANRDYAQVLSEVAVDDSLRIAYTYGDDLLSQKRGGTTSYFHYDGLGPTRMLTDATGAVTDGYDYAAFGELLNSTGSTGNSYLFAGEQLDSGLGQYYLRARYYDPGRGGFTQMDAWLGKACTPISLCCNRRNSYKYGNAAVNRRDIYSG